LDTNPKKEKINQFIFCVFVGNQIDKQNWISNRAPLAFLFVSTKKEGKEFCNFIKKNCFFLFSLVWIKDLPMLYYFMSWFDSSDFVIHDIDPIWYHQNKIYTIVERFIISMGLNPEFFLLEI